MKQAYDLPDDIDSLRNLVVKMQGEIDHLRSRQASLQEQIRLSYTNALAPTAKNTPPSKATCSTKRKLTPKKAP